MPYVAKIKRDDPFRAADSREIEAHHGGGRMLGEETLAVPRRPPLRGHKSIVARGEWVDEVVLTIAVTDELQSSP